MKNLAWGAFIAIVLCAVAIYLVVVFGRPPAITSGPGRTAPAAAFFDDLLKVYTPRQRCMYYEQSVIWLHIISDFLTAIAYYSIPFALVHFVRRRRDVAYSWVFWTFAAFILACGTTHLFGVINIWVPFYRLDGIVKFITAIASIGTAVALWPLLPKALALPSPAQLEETVRQRTAELAEANSHLRAEIAARTEAEHERERLLLSERAAREDAERASRLKDEFLATLSHELRTPLNAIVGWSHILRTRPASEEDLREGLDVISRNARVQAQLVEDLLDMSRIISGKLRLDIRPVDLADVINAAVQSVVPAAEAKGVTLEQDLAPHLPAIRGDLARLQQVVWNLLSNAVKFTPRGGRVRVALDRAHSHIRLSVTDTGEGIPPEFLPHVFERFRQADSTSTRKHGGLGLGLAIVRHLVELHGGYVEVHSDGPGRGATFTVALPLHPADIAEPADQPSNEPPASISLANLTILAIDDEPDACALVRHILQSAGASVLTASSVPKALALLDQHRFSLIFCDIGMPEQDGYSFVRALRRRSPEQGGQTPAVALTAFASSEDRQRALMAGFQMHLPKPIEPAELVIVAATLAARNVT